MNGVVHISYPQRGEPATDALLLSDQQSGVEPNHGVSESAAFRLGQAQPGGHRLELPTRQTQRVSRGGGA